MRATLGSMFTILALCIGATAADDKIDGSKLLGKWSPKDKKGVVIEFAKEGKLSLTAGEGDKAFKATGTYKLDGNKLTTTVKLGDMEKSDVITISKLTDTELTGKDDKGKEDTLVKIKDK